MKAQPFDDEEEIEASIDSQDTTSKTSSAMKLERRRRIEELNEERRMREELSEF